MPIRSAKFVAAVVASLFAMVVLPAGNAAAIAGGTEVPLGKYPWLVKIGNPLEGYCSGSLVSTRHVLTAAHCVAKNPDTPTQMFANFNGVTPPKTGLSVRVVRSERHPRGGDARNADIAMLTLEHPVPVRPISLVAPDVVGPILPGRTLTVAGYGKTDSQQEAASNRARELVVTATDTCTKTGEQWFCANAPNRHAGIRPEDSGAPAFATLIADCEVRHVLLGTASNHHGANTWFANLSLPAFNYWIREAIS